MALLLLPPAGYGGWVGESVDRRQCFQRFVHFQPAQLRGLDLLAEQAGLLSLNQTNWWTAPKNGDRLLVYVPADEASERALRTLASLKPSGAAKTLQPE